LLRAISTSAMPSDVEVDKRVPRLGKRQQHQRPQRHTPPSKPPLWHTWELMRWVQPGTP
jgi:hypothetical protein